MGSPGIGPAMCLLLIRSVLLSAWSSQIVLTMALQSLTIVNVELFVCVLFLTATLKRKNEAK